MEADTAEQALSLARRAMELNPDCVDALMVLLLKARTMQGRAERLARAVEVGRRSLGGAKYFEENEGHFWGLVETRP